MIYTLTANPAIDYNISCDGLAANTVTRTRNAVYTPNGKGLNVSFTLDHYGVDTTILGFFAGFSGEFIVKGAEALGVPVKPVWTDGITRVNVFLNAGPDTEYNMVNAGAAINEANEQEMFELIDSLDDMTCLVISGSLPPNTSEGFLAEVLRRVKAKGAEFVLDISSHQLADLIAMEPLLIKPNDDELLDIFGIKVSGGDDESVKGAMAELHAKGAKNVLLTLGGAGAYFSNGEHIWFANRTFDVKLLSTVCAGDSSLPSCPCGTTPPSASRTPCAFRWLPAPTWSSARAWATLPRSRSIRRASLSARSANSGLKLEYFEWFASVLGTGRMRFCLSDLRVQGRLFLARLLADAIDNQFDSRRRPQVCAMFRSTVRTRPMPPCASFVRSRRPVLRPGTWAVGCATP